MRIITSIFVVIIICSASRASAQRDSVLVAIKGWDHAAAFEISVPLGAFASSHIAGAGLDYSWSRHRYGWDLNPRHLLGFTVHAGGAYFMGKKEIVADNDFRFGGYMDLHVLPGIIYNPYANVNLSLVAGPALGIYKGNSDLGIGAKFSANYYFRDRISIGPAVMYRRDEVVESLWSVMLRTTYNFHLGSSRKE